eukprot:CAMPEP_0167753580 /NCGR_PEP_ID=MMETSP0110_2-20121227/7794_1 /TAXON_ID=629695 /ORGANISM="Gymnochlora sp., Strain CCMP2014" /LENGTH=736 /DNA_ID=CAMNT_0007639365 /DNA_START=24 /DNA_END=2231 /DNA_ORIENTATION=-
MSDNDIELIDLADESRVRVKYGEKVKKLNAKKFESGLESLLQWVTEYHKLDVNKFEVIARSVDKSEAKKLRTNEDLTHAVKTGCTLEIKDVEIKEEKKEFGDIESIAKGFLLCQDESMNSNPLGWCGLCLLGITSIVWVLIILYGSRAPQVAGVKIRWLGRPQGKSLPKIEQIQAALVSIQEAKKRLCKQWPDNEDCRLLTRGFPDDFADGGDLIVQKIMHSILDKSTYNFTVTVTGSSTSAGHDTHFKYSYAVQMQRIMEKHFKDVGVELVVNNMAMGGWDYREGTIFCLDNIAGSKSDIIFWEWGMFEPTSCSQEVFARAAMSLERRPAVIFFEKVGGGNPGAMYHTLIYYDLKDDHPEKKELFKEYLRAASCPSGKYYFGPPEQFLDVDRLADFNARMIRENKCKNRTPNEEWYHDHAEELFAITPKTKPAPVSTTELFPVKHGDYYANKSFPVYRASADTTYDVDFKPWWLSRMGLFRVVHHAGPLGHLLASNMLSYRMLSFLERAILRINLAMIEGNLDQLQGDVRKKTEDHELAPLPPPKECSWPSMEFPQAPGDCFTSFQPRQGKGLDKLLDHGGGSEGRWHTDFAEDGQKTKWYLNETVGDFLDRKGDIGGNKTSGWVHFQLPPRSKRGDIRTDRVMVDKTHVIVCQGQEINVLEQCDFKLDGKLWYKAANSSLKESAPYSSSNIAFKKGDGFSLQTCGVLGPIDGRTEHLLSIQVVGKDHVQLSHII